MALDILRLGDCTFYGPALPEPYVRFELEKALAKHKLLPEADGLAGQTLRDQWDIFRRKLRDVSPNSGPVAITNRIIEPLVSRLGYASLTPADDVLTREGNEAGGLLMADAAGAKLRVWAIEYDADLDAPTQRGYAYRFSPIRIAQRVLLATGERVGLITNGVELRLLLCDPARPDSHIEIDLNVWRLSRDLPDGYLLLLAVAGPKGIAALPEIIEDARLKQNKVTKELRVQARLAVEEFVQAVLDQPDNAASLSGQTDKAALSKQLWHEGLIVVYRLLFILKCESTSDPSRVFRFASTPLWRNTYSPSTALARMVRRVLDEGAPSGRYLEDGVRVLFKLFADGLDHPGLTVRPLGGALFGAASTPLLSSLRWGEVAVAHLLNRLLWSDTRRGRERVHYGPLDVEDLGRVYEALLELEPGIATEPMCRLRRQKLEVVVPAAQGNKYKAAGAAVSTTAADADENDDEEVNGEEEAEDDKPTQGKKTKVEWIGAIKPGRFYLRVGLGRKSSGSYYTPHSFVRFLVQETLGPQCDERSPRDNPNPGAILKLKVLDPACGSGHFLVEACRFLAGRVYEAARLCDELASKADHDADAEKNAARKQGLLDRVAELRQRLKDLPDNEDELLSYLPSHSAGADKAVLSAHDIARAEAICRRLVAVHCIYGADLNPLAVELAKLSLWIESHAEGFPLTFLDHRVVLGNSLTGPFWDKLIFAPGSQEPIEGLWRQGLFANLTTKLGEALTLVRRLEASVGVDVQDIAAKQQLKRELDARLLPFRILAAAWSGGVMLGTDPPDGAPRCDDDAYADLLKHVGTNCDLPAIIDNQNLCAMITKGLGMAVNDAGPFDPRTIPTDARPALPFDLIFPEVFHPTGQPHGRSGFEAVIGNPPWDAIQFKSKEFFAAFDFEILNAHTKRERTAIEQRLTADPICGTQFNVYVESFEEQKRAIDALFEYQKVFIEGDLCGRQLDAFRVFMERNAQLLGPAAVTGVVVPSAFHANEGATGVRRLYLEKLALRCCFSFENRNKLFEIDSRFKFALVVAQKGKATEQFACAFYLHDDQWLFGDRKDRPALTYTLEFVKKTGGEYLSLLELQSEADGRAAVSAFGSGVPFGKASTEAGIVWGRECDMTNDAWRFTPLDDLLTEDVDPRDANTGSLLNARGHLVLREGKTFWHFDDFWLDRPVYSVALERLTDKPDWCRASRYFRGAYRAVASSTNERTIVFCLIPPGAILGNNAPCDREPWTTGDSLKLFLIAVANTYPFDWTARIRVGANINQFILFTCRVPFASEAMHTLIVHSALRLTCNHAGYEPLWREQLGDAWRESAPPERAPSTWPVLVSDDERWAVRAAIDAVVADAYGLSREQYSHVLSTFSHSSYKKAPDLCLAAFDELKAIGLDAFCAKHDPYHDIPLVETLPKPVINLPIPDDSADADTNNGGRKARGRNRKGKRDMHPVLWEEKGGQLTLEPPGPIFDRSASGKPATNAPDPGKVLAVKTLLEMRKVLTSAEVQAEFNLEPAAARAILKHLADKGEARVEGKAKGTRYLRVQSER